MKQNKSGFTLVEVLVGSVLIIALGLGILGIQTILGENQVWFWKSYLKVDQANSLVQNMTKEMRMIRAGDNGAYPLELANDNEIIFYSDVDFDGQAEKIHYRREGTELARGIIEPAGYPVIYPEEDEKIITLSDDVRNNEAPVFYYYNRDWPEDTANNPLTPPLTISDTKLIGVYLRLNSESDQPEKDYVLDSYAQIRNLKDNL